MKVDVTTETVIARPRAEVAAYAGDPSNAPSWYANIKAIEWKTTPPIPRVGARMAFVAQFLGKRLEYTYEIVEFVPGERLVMRTSEGPFAMQTTYLWTSTPEGHTRMTLRNSGEPKGFASIAAPLMARAMRRENEKDLARLKAILETRG